MKEARTEKLMYQLHRLWTDISYPFRRVVWGIKNLWKWFPIIWNDRDWDHAYIEYLLLTKLQSMYNRFSDPHKTYVDWNTKHAAKALKALRICITILERRRSSFYVGLWDSDKEELTDEIMIKVDYTEQRDWKLLHKLMEQYMEYWWD